MRYHPGPHAADFRFLTPARLPHEYDELNKLFFGVLNRPAAQRPPDVQAAFRELPYLNSSLFQPAALEMQCSTPTPSTTAPACAPFPQSVLKKRGGPARPHPHRQNPVAGPSLPPRLPRRLRLRLRPHAPHPNFPGLPPPTEGGV
ncbi:MAG: hypothetical protein WKG07_15850 [Hymenobacter sp.]